MEETGLLLCYPTLEAVSGNIQPTFLFLYRAQVQNVQPTHHARLTEMILSGPAKATADESQNSIHLWQSDGFKLIIYVSHE